MFSDNVTKGVHFSRCVRRFSLSVSRAAIQKKSPSFYEVDKRNQPALPLHVREAIANRLNAPFSEVKQGTWMTTLLRSLQMKEVIIPQRFSWNMDTISWDNIVRSVHKSVRNYNIFQQRFLPQRHDQLGNEIAAAHFLVFRGGAVKFYGVEKWIKMEKNEDPDLYDKYLPKTFNPRVYVECINLDNVEIYFEGLDNLRKLSQLRWLSLRNSKHFDDWALDKITNEYSDSLEYLDISGCKNITYNGLCAICKLTHLTTLVVENMTSNMEFELTCVMLQETLPNLHIQGVTYLDTEIVSINSEKITNCDKL